MFPFYLKGFKGKKKGKWGPGAEGSSVKESGEVIRPSALKAEG